MSYDHQIKLANHGNFFANHFSWSMRDWLNEHIGDYNKDWWYDHKTNRIFFRSEEDKVKFILQWM